MDTAPTAPIAPTDRPLDGRVAIVTGAGSGIGRATALALATAGAHVLGVGRRPGPLDETAAAAPGVVAHPADVCAEGTPEAVVAAALDRWGRLDVLVNNAGATAVMPVDEVTATGITDLFALNVVAPSLLVRAARPRLREQTGSVINISSTYGSRPLPGAAHYAASKAAIEQLTRSWALELAPDGVRVNAVAPGPTETDALAAAGLAPEAVDAIVAAERDAIPLGRRGRADDVAAWVLHLADPRSSWVTGQVIGVDGGMALV